MRGGGWGEVVLSLVLVFAANVAASPLVELIGEVPGPATDVTIRVDNGTSVTLWERTTDMNILTYSVATLTGPGGTFDSLASEHYTFTSDGAYLMIHCFRPAHGQGTSTGNNIAAARLDGVPNYPSGLWATEIISYIVGEGGIESSRFAALGSNLSDITYMGDQDSELVLAFTVEQVNRAPTIVSFTSTPTTEGSAVTFEASASDPDGDALTYSFDFESDGTWDVSGPDATVSQVFGDDFSGTARLRVSDGSLSSETTTEVHVANVAPSVDASLSVAADMTLRVAGEKWHDVTLTLYDGTFAAATASVVRTPGSPDDQAVTVSGLAFDVLSGDLSAVVVYTPMDDPLNGQVNGANPAWLILTSEDGSEVRAHHTFNVLQPESWTWTVEDVRILLVGFPIRFEGSAADPGSDDLTFTWSWGDGSPDTVTTYFNDGVGPDGPASTEVNPIAVTEIQRHGFATGGTHTVTLTIADDDGGTTSATLVVTL